MRHLGDFNTGGVIRLRFNTHKADGTPITLAGTPAVSIYKDGGTTESTAGVTLTVDFDSRTGMHLVAIDTSADGAFYAGGSDFEVVITAGTVDSISVVGTVVGAFSLLNRSALRPATAGRTLVVDAAGLADANVVKLGPTGAGTAQTARDVGANVVAASVTAGVTVTTNNDKTGYSLSSGAVQAIWDALTSALVTAGSIGKLLTDNINATISSRLATSGYTAPPSAATIAAAVWDSLTSALVTAASVGKLLVDNLNATISSRLASASYTAPLDAAGVRGAVGLASANLDTQLAALPTAAAVAAQVTSDHGSGSYVRNTEPLDAAGVRTAVGLATANLDTQLSTLASYVDTEVAAIKAKTDALPGDPASAATLAAAFAVVNATLATIAAYVDTEVAAIKAKTDALPTDPADASDVAAQFATVNASLATIAAYVDTEVAAIKAKTDNLPSDPADASDLAALFASVNASLTTIAGYVDTEVAAIKAKTDLIAGTPAVVGDAMTLSAGERNSVADALLDRALAGHNTAGTLGEALHLARAQAGGKWVIADDVLSIYDLDGTTLLATLDLAPAGGPFTSRTPA